MEETRHDTALTDIKCPTLQVDGIEIGTPRQLARLLGTDEALVWNHHEGHMDWCLCAIDVPRSLRGSGLTLRKEDGKLLIERTVLHHV